MKAVPPGQELGGHLGKQGQRQHVLLRLGDVLELLFVGFQLRGDVVRRTAGDDRLRVDACQRPDLRVHLAGQRAVLAPQQSLGLLGEGLVLAHDDVHHRLGAYDLAGGGHQRGIAEVLADAGNLRQHVVILVLLPSLLELGDQVGQHAAGNLIEQGVGVHPQDLGVQNALVLQTGRHLAEVGRRLAELGLIQPGVPDGAPQRGHQRLRGGLRGAVGQRGQGGIHNVHTGHSRHQVHHVAGAGGVVGVEMDGNRDRLL